MKNMFNAIVLTLAVVVGLALWWFWLGNPANFADGTLRHSPINTLGTIHTGGPLVGVLVGFLLMTVTFVVERSLSISKARGKGDMVTFIKAVQVNLEQGNVHAAIVECDKNRGSVANVLRAGLERFEQVDNDKEISPDKKLAEVQRAIDEAVNLETPLLEKNLVMISTVASISTMVGLLGTTLGMISAFAALGESGGAVSAQALSIGISEALYNTAGGLVAAVLCIVFYNFFTTKVDNFIYMIDEAILSMMEILTIRVKK
ncbi:MAG: MotA/TolQ/ExbB proton channel family protein [Ignavibacteria bacterium]|nr:MotA/TolQ/ExbB proton channel family protein [Ignavibacteria bacterium]